MGTATLHISDLGGYSGPAKCYRLDPPRVFDGQPHEYVTVCIQPGMAHMNAEVYVVPATESGAVAGMSVWKRTGSHVLDSDADTPERVAEVHARALDRLDHYVIVQPEPEPGEE